MAENAPRLKITFDWVQILDDLEPPWDQAGGEFRFEARVESDGRATETRIPEKGTFSIMDHPAWNRRDLNLVIYEGEVGDEMVVELRGVERDILSADDELEPYRREFAGDPESWLGVYKYTDEGPEDPESLSNWRVCYRIERAD